MAVRLLHLLAVVHVSAVLAWVIFSVLPVVFLLAVAWVIFSSLPVVFLPAVAWVIFSALPVVFLLAVAWVIFSVLPVVSLLVVAWVIFSVPPVVFLLATLQRMDLYLTPMCYLLPQSSVTGNWILQVVFCAMPCSSAALSVHLAF